MVSLVTSASTYLKTASVALAQTSYGPYVQRAAAHWNLPLGASVGYAINGYKKIADYPAVGITLAIATIYFGGASAIGGILLGASAAGRDLGIPAWVIIAIDYVGKASILSMLVPLGAFTIGLPIAVRCFFGAFVYAGYNQFQDKFTNLSAAIGLIALHACAGTAGLVTFIGLLFLQSPMADPETTAEERPRMHNFSTRFDVGQAFSALTGGQISSIEGLNREINKIKALGPNEGKRDALIQVADCFAKIAKRESSCEVTTPPPTQESKFGIYKAWYRAWSMTVHPDKNPNTTWAEPLFQVLSNWYAQVEELKERVIEE